MFVTSDKAKSEMPKLKAKSNRARDVGLWSDNLLLFLKPWIKDH